MAERVIMLAGGQGSRLLPYRTVVPKPLMPVGNRAVLELMLRQVARHGLTKVTLAVGDLAPLIQAMFGDGGRIGVSIAYSQEHEPLGTAGVLGHLELDEPFVVMNGNVLTTLDFREMLDAHAASGNAVTVATHRREVLTDFGVLDVSGGNNRSSTAQIVRYVDKPATTYTVSMGIYAMEPFVCGYIGRDEHIGLPELVQRVIEDGHRVGAHAHDGLWLDLRRREDYEQAVARYEEISPLFGEIAA